MTTPAFFENIPQEILDAQTVILSSFNFIAGDQHFLEDVFSNGLIVAKEHPLYNMPDLKESDYQFTASEVVTDWPGRNGRQILKIILPYTDRQVTAKMFSRYLWSLDNLSALYVSTMDHHLIDFSSAEEFFTVIQYIEQYVKATDMAIGSVDTADNDADGMANQLTSRTLELLLVPKVKPLA